MKPAWRDAIYEIAASGKRFYHDEDCPGVIGNVSKCLLRCAAGPANKALDEMDKALRIGIPDEI